MNNLHRELAPISEAAWADLEEEARRTFKRHVAGRRVVDVPEPGGRRHCRAVGTGHLDPIDAARRGRDRPPARSSQPLVELRVPFTVEPAGDRRRRARRQGRRLAAGQGRRQADRVRRGPGGLRGLRRGRHRRHPRELLQLRSLACPRTYAAYPNAVSQAVSALRLAGVDGPYSLLLSADAYTAVNETSDHGYPIREHLARVLDGEIIWAPAIDGAFLLSTRGGDFELRLGQDLSIGYLSHDATSVRLYFQESLTFLVHTAEAAVALSGGVTGSGPGAVARTGDGRR